MCEGQAFKVEQLQDGIARIERHIQECDVRIQNARTMLAVQDETGLRQQMLEHAEFRAGMAKALEHLSYAGVTAEALQASPAPSALDTARAALERIANESDLRMSAYLNSDDMLRDYIGKVVRMKRIAADALAGLEGGEQP